MNRFAVAALLAFVVSHARAADPWFPGAKPTKVPTDLLPGVKGPARAFVHWDKSPVLADPTKPESEVLKADLLATRYDIGARHKTAGGQEYLLLVKRVDPSSATNLDIRDDGYLGWVRADQVLAFVGTRPTALPDPNTDVYRKCMLVNTLEDVSKAAALGDLVSFYAHPGAPRPGDRAPIRRPLFQIYYVFAETSTHYFLGTKAEPTADDPPRDVLLGWVPRGRVCPWNTREAVEFDKNPNRTQPARMFKTRDDLVHYLKDRPKPADVASGKYRPQPLATEDLKDGPLKHFQSRFPLVSDEEAQDSGLEAPGLGGYRLYRVGVIGDVYDRNRERQFSASRSDLLRRDLEELRNQVRTIQVMFVIDATHGMDPWFKTGGATVRKIVTAVQALGDAGAVKPKVEFSVNFYRDRDGTDLKVFENHRFTDDVTAVLDQFDKVRALGGGAPLDLPLEGVCKALDAHKEPGQPSAFKPNAVKILILIGDDGQDPADKEFTVDKVADKLAAAGGASPIGFFAVSVGDQKKKEYKLFTEQTEALARKLTERELKARAERLSGLKDGERALGEMVGRPLVSHASDAVLRAIERRFNLSVAEMRFKRQQLVRLEQSGGEADDTLVALAKDHPLATSYGVIWEQQVLDALKDKKLDDLLKVRDGIQLFVKGWAADHDPRQPETADGKPVPQLRHMVLIERGEVAKMKDYLVHVTANWDRTKMRATWEKSLDQVTYGDLTLLRKDAASPQALMRRMFRGVKAQDGVLALPFDQIAKMPDDQVAELHKRLKGAVRQLDDALNERNGKLWWGGELSDNGLDQRAWLPRTVLP